MLERARRIVVFGVMAVTAVVISLPVISFAAVSPSVSVLSPLNQGLRVPVKLTLDNGGNIYVADQRAGGVAMFNTYGVRLAAVNTAKTPAGLALALDGSLLVSQSSFVARYNPATGEEIGRLTGGQLQVPGAIAVDDVTGYIYVADGGAGQIEVYTADGRYVNAFAKGLLTSIGGVSFEKVSRQLAVADTLGNKVKFFDLEGNLVKSFGNAVPTALGARFGAMQFAAPVAVAFEYSKEVLSRMYVVDAFQGNVQVIDPAGSGSFLGYVGSAGAANGQLMVPSDAAFDAVNSRLLVVNGYGNVTLYGIDGGKNPVDVTPPAFTLASLPSEVAVSAVTLSGTVEAGSAVTVVVDNAALVAPVSYSGSSWSVLVTGLAYGVNNFTVSAKDAAGNISAPQYASVNYLTPAPALTIAPTASFTRFAKVTVSGTVEAGSIVTVANQTTNVSGAASVTGAEWSYEVALADGVNSIVVSAQKAQSARSEAGIALVLDAQAPLLNVSALSNESKTSTQVQNISGTVSDQSAVSVAVNNIPAVLAGNSFSVPVTLAGGANLISVVATDAAGNVTVNDRTLYFEVAYPVVTVSSPVDNSFVSNAELRLTGSVDKPSAVTVAGVPAVVDADNNWSATVALVAGINTIEIIATDLNGNKSTLKRSVTLDAVKPNLAITQPAQDVALNVPNVLLAGTVSDSTVVSLDYSVNGAAAVAASVVDGAYSFNIDFAAEGNYAVTLTAKDSAGNVSTVVRNVIYDVTPPVLALDQVNGVMPEKISGSVEANATVVVKDGSKLIATATTDGSGIWVADLKGVSYSPDSLLVVAQDAAGNSTSKTLTYSFPDGTMEGAGKPTIKDALAAMRLVVNKTVQPTAQQLAHYDVGPLVDGRPNPNGKIDIVDAILILRKALGMKSW